MAGWINNLPIIVAVVPLVGSAVVSYTVRRGDTVPAGLTGLISFITLTLTWWQFLLVRQHGILTCGLPGSLGLSLNWRVDFIGAFFSVVVAAVCSGHNLAREYMNTSTARLGFCQFHIHFGFYSRCVCSWRSVYAFSVFRNDDFCRLSACYS